MITFGATVVALVPDGWDGVAACDALSTGPVVPERIVLLGRARADAKSSGGIPIVVRDDLSADCRGLVTCLGGISSEWTAVVGPFCLPHPGWLSELVQALDLSSGAACAGGRVLSLRGCRTAAGWLSDGEPVAAVSWNGSLHLHFGDRTIEPNTGQIEFVDGRDMLVVTSILKGLSGELSSFSPAGAGLLLGAHLRRSGKLCLYAPKAVVVESVPANADAARDRRCLKAESLGFEGLYAQLRGARNVAGFFKAIAFLVIGQRASPGVLAWPACVLGAERFARWRSALGGRFRALRLSFASRGSREPRRDHA